MCGEGGVQGAKIFVNDQSRSLGAPLAKCLEILCAAMPYSAAWVSGMRQGSLSNITEVIPSFIKMDFLDNGRTKPIPRGKKKDKSALLEMEGSEHKCLIRATNGKKKISTVVSKNC